MHRLEALQARLAPLYAQLAQHPLYRSFHTIDDVRVFMQSHVFAVWDFMSLLKTLQRGLTCVNVPWIPTADAETRRLINEIVLGEESDLYEGRAVSHFELYLEAMRACGASTDGIAALLSSLSENRNVHDALAALELPAGVGEFVTETFTIIESGNLHAVAAAFTFGREDLIPDIFQGFIRDQNETLSGQLNLFRWYLDRHIEVDGEEHGPMALRMVANLCGNEDAKWKEAEDAAIRAVEARIAFWNSICAALPSAIRA